MILAIRTDKPEAEISLYSSEGQLLISHTWYAHRELSKTLLQVVHEQLAIQQADFRDITGIIVFRGPGSFTGLRIGITVANTLAYGLSVPIVGTESSDWQETGIARLGERENDKLVMPLYGAEAHITTQKK